MALADDLAATSISDLDLGRYIAIGPSETVAAVVEGMRQSGFSSACVVDDDRLVGVFTQRDVLMRVLGRSRVCELPISEEMTRSPKTLRADQSVADGLAIMRDWWVRSVPVVDENDKLVGSLSWYTVMRTIAGLLTGPTDDDAEPGVSHGLAFVDFTGLDTRAPVLVSRGDTADVAAHHMQARAMGSVLVVDQRGRLVGIITEFDLLVKLACTGVDLATVSVDEVTSPEVVAIEMRSPIGAAIQQMADRGFSHAPLLGESSRPVGVASFRDLVEYFETTLHAFA